MVLPVTPDLPAYRDQEIVFGSRNRYQILGDCIKHGGFSEVYKGKVKDLILNYLKKLPLLFS